MDNTIVRITNDQLILSMIDCFISILQFITGHMTSSIAYHSRMVGPQAESRSAYYGKDYAWHSQHSPLD